MIVNRNGEIMKDILSSVSIHDELLSYDLENKEFFFDKVMYSSVHPSGINSAIRLVFKTDTTESSLILSFHHFVFVKEERNGTLLHHEAEKVKVG